MLLQNYNITWCFVWLWNLDSHIERRAQIKGIWEQSAEDPREKQVWELEKTFIIMSFILCTLQKWFSNWVSRNPGVPRRRHRGSVKYDKNFGTSHVFTHTYRISILILNYEYKIIFKTKWIQNTKVNWMLRQISDCNCSILYQILNWCVHQNTTYVALRLSIV
jgi:hypothetical protein